MGRSRFYTWQRKGDFLGYHALLGEESYSNSATIIKDAKICFIPKEAFLGSMMKNPDFFRRITKQLSHELGIMEEKLIDASQKSIRERLAFLLLQLANTYGVDGGVHQQIDLILSREEITGMVGTATESVIRLLSEFNKDGLIELDGKKIRIKDKKGLVRLSDFYA